MRLENNISRKPAGQSVLKRMLDIFLSIAAFILLSPVFIYVAIRVYFSSQGPILYSQERVGYMGRKFVIKKFRSMYINAETNGPRLAMDNDERITRWGRTMRKWKLDELPQLWNVLAGEMSIVGPRPEREYFIRQLEQNQQPFQHLLQVKPGLTSLGMIKYGYAANVSEMKERMKYDLMYIENKSLTLDMKIILGTVRIILMAKGR